MLLRNMAEGWVSYSLEAIVTKGLAQTRYLRKDLVLNIALSLPIYALMLLSSLGLPFSVGLSLASGVLIIVGHLIVSSCVLGAKLKDPFPVETAKEDGRAEGSN